MAALSDGLVSKRVIAKKPDPGDCFGAFGLGLTFEQHKEMFLLQREREWVQLERERLQLEQEAEIGSSAD